MLTLESGRTLCYELFGDVGGTPAYFFHGFPGSRLQARLIHEQARAAGVCLVAFDRSGFGRSSHNPGRNMASISGDVLALSAHLGHERFSLVGVSCGAAHALACAHGLPDRVERVGLFAGMGPMDIPGIRKDQLPVLTAMFSLARLSPLLVLPLLLPDLLLFRRNPVKAVAVLSRLLTPPDRELLARDSSVAEIFSDSLTEAYRQGLSGAMREAHLIGSRRPYRFEDIAPVVTVFQPGHDRHVPVAMGQYIASSVRNGEFRFCPDDGHLSVLITQFPGFAADLVKTSIPP